VQLDDASVGSLQEFDSGRNALVGGSAIVDHPIRFYKNIFH
jgi:hypothetical protein